MSPVVQKERTGCGIASCAALAGISYDAAKGVANSIGIYADDKALFSDTAYVRKLLEYLGIKTSLEEKAFTSWNALPDTALLAIKWREKEEKAFWHWTCFVRRNGEAAVWDSGMRLKSPVRTDFWRMQPKWYIAVL